MTKKILQEKINHLNKISDGKYYLAQEFFGYALYEYKQKISQSINVFGKHMSRGELGHAIDDYINSGYTKRNN